MTTDEGTNVTCEKVLTKCLSAKNPKEQESAFQRLASQLRDASNDTTIKETVARRILLECPYGQVSSLVDQALDSCGIVVALSTSTTILKEIASASTNEELSSLPPPSIVNACWTTIRRFLLVPTKKNNAEDQQKGEISETKHLIKTVLLLPQIVANACHSIRVNAPLGATPAHFYPRLVECSLLSQGDDHFFQLLIHSMLTSRKSEYVAIGLAGHHPCPALTKLEMSPRESAAILYAMLLHAESTPNSESSASKPNPKDVMETCHMIAKKTSYEDCEVWVQVLVLTGHNRDRSLVPYIVNLLDQTGNLYDHLCDIAETWSQWTFCQETDLQQQQYVTETMLCGLATLRKETGEEDAASADSDDLSLSLLQGVSNRLESFQPAIRRDGMKVAQAIAKRLGQSIHFEELDEEEATPKFENDVEKKESTEAEQAAENVPTPQNHPKKKKTKKTRPTQMDPDADYDSDYGKGEEEENSETESEDRDDDSTVWDDELVPYDLDDDEEDLVETPTPVHLLECLEFLRTPESDDHAYSRHETGLESLPALIRKRPDDLPDVAVSLMRELLRMENKFNMEGFAAKKHDSLVGLTVVQPVVVGQKLTEEVFRDAALSDRLNMLAALQEAAYELSGAKSIDEKRSIELKKQQLLNSPTSPVEDIRPEQPSPLDASKQALMRRLTGKSRRKRSSRKPLETFINEFSSVAPIWFYSLIARFMHQKEKESLWTGSTGTQLLSEILRTLATIVEFSGVQSSQVLAQDLFELAWPFHDTDVAEIRLSVLVSVATAIAMLPEERILHLVLGGSAGQSLPQIIGEMSSADPSRECRSLAQTISMSIVEVLDQSLITS